MLWQSHIEQNPDEEIAFKSFARVYLGLSGEALQTAVERGIFLNGPRPGQTERVYIFT